MVLCLCQPSIELASRPECTLPLPANDTWDRLPVTLNKDTAVPHLHLYLENFLKFPVFLFCFCVQVEPKMCFIHLLLTKDNCVSKL